ncbi:glycine cleavage system transcriptional repressor [Pseudomonas massiliensis]|uniref:glycine cleavage system protein R n=1 Tax=Pseudomonas massiliensis TaxID=522492 RepID=UPI00058AF51E|nr:ACT domain-containing protein [Pseudomonas massiliensis]
MEQLVLTVLAPDKAGQVESIAECVAAHQGNWLESQMARMGGHFAGILRIEVPASRKATLTEALGRLQERGIGVLIEPTAPLETGRWKPVNLSLTANDRPGIVRDISRLLAGQGVNVERLSTAVCPAPMSNEALFQAQAQLAVPEGLALGDLQRAFETLADELLVELNLTAAV